jgi:hypothetical protein
MTETDVLRYIEARRRVEAVTDLRTKVRLRAEVWARVYAAEYAALRTATTLRNQAGEVVLLSDSEARLAATRVANAAGKDFDTYCQMVDLK